MVQNNKMPTVIEQSEKNCPIYCRHSKVSENHLVLYLRRFCAKQLPFFIGDRFECAVNMVKHELEVFFVSGRDQRRRALIEAELHTGDHQVFVIPKGLAPRFRKKMFFAIAPCSMDKRFHGQKADIVPLYPLRNAVAPACINTQRSVHRE